MAAGPTPSDRGPRHHLVIRPTGGWRSLDLREVWRFRDLLGAMTRRDVTLRYRQTLLGVAWVVLQPLLAAGIFSFVFGSVAHFSSGGTPYLVFSFAGMLAYNAFSSTTTSMATCLVTNSPMVAKVYFPRVVLPIAQLGSKMVDLVVGLALFAVLDGVYGLGVHLSMLTLPLWTVLVYGLALGFGLLTSAANVAYRDVGYIVPVAASLLLYLSPVAYNVSQVPGHLRTAYDLNPLVGIIEGFRWCLLGHGQLSSGAVGYAAAFAAGMLILGGLYFRHHERRFADVI